MTADSENRFLLQVLIDKLGGFDIMNQDPFVVSSGEDIFGFDVEIQTENIWVVFALHNLKLESVSHTHNKW